MKFKEQKRKRLTILYNGGKQPSGRQEDKHGFRGIIRDVVGRCFRWVLEREVTEALGRKLYQRHEQAVFGPSNGQCGRCHTRDRRKFSRNGHYTRYLDTNWGGSGSGCRKSGVNVGEQRKYPFRR